MTWLRSRLPAPPDWLRRLGPIPRGLAGFPLVVLALAGLALFRDQLGVSFYYLTILYTIFFWVAQATSWNILSGYSGYFSFGQGAFVGVGVYTTAVLMSRYEWSFVATLPVAAALSALLALGIGAVAFRLGSFRGATFALLTLAVPFILAAVARLSSHIDGGRGVQVRPDLPGGLRFAEFLYLVLLVVAGAAVLVAFLIQHSRFGWALAAIRDNEDVAEGMGVATFWWKLAAIATTGAIGGMAGSAWALNFGYVQVEVVFGLMIPLFVIVMSVLGGRTHWLGPVIGAVVIVLLQDRLAVGEFNHLRLVIFGGLLALMVIFAPDGLWARLRARPWPVLAVGASTMLVLATGGWFGSLLDWILVAILAAALVAFWPESLFPSWLSRPGPAAPAAGDAGPAVGATAVGATAVAAEPESVAAPGPAVPGPQREGAPVVVECHELARYFGGVKALDGLDLAITEGELVGLVGPNGSGKTTLVNLLSGALRPTRGRIRIAGRDVVGLAPHRFTHVGVTRTYQIPRPYESMTVRDNVAMALMFGRQPRRLAPARAEAMTHLEFVGLHHLAGVRPADINLHQRQLLEMARALATSPKVLLLDECLAGLNPAEIDNAVQVVRRIHAAGVTIVIVEHLLRVVNQLATRVVVLDRGTLLADGEPARVMNDPAVVRAYLGKSHGGASWAGDADA